MMLGTNQHVILHMLDIEPTLEALKGVKMELIDADVVAAGYVNKSANIEMDMLSVAPYGFEKSTWDPSTDYFLPENFNAENMNGKAVCKAALLQRLGLSEHSSTILVG
jgi:hypothetical protein